MTTRFLTTSFIALAIASNAAPVSDLASRPSEVRDNARQTLQQNGKNGANLPDKAEKDRILALRKIGRTKPVPIPDARAKNATLAPIQFLPRRLSNCRTEACGVADFNNDGKLDIVAGPFLYLAPDWKPVKIREIKSDVKENGKGYADDFMNLTLDVNRDGRMDIVSGGWFSKTSYWFENKAGNQGLWPVHQIEQAGNHETGILVDINGDGKAEEFLPHTHRAFWYELSKTGKDNKPFIRHDLGPKVMLGGGAGDLNGDGKPDVIYPDRWFEAPLTPEGKWKEHPIALGGPNMTAQHTSNILVFDVNHDGKNDIIASSAHRPGIFWYEQISGKDNTISWKQHTIDDTWTQAHYLALADIDQDNIPELITGKRFMAHNGGDPDAFGTLCIFYYDFEPGKEVAFRKHIISYDEGISIALNVVPVDIDQDGDIDLVTTGKFGGPILLENRMFDTLTAEERKAALSAK